MKIVGINSVLMNTQDCNPMSQVFISYSENDERFNRLIKYQLIALLKEHWFEPWLSERNLPAGVYWDNSILQALKRSDWFIIVISPESVKSESVKNECHWALDHLRNRVIPLYVEDCEVEALNLSLTRINWIDTRNKNWDDVGRKILERICGVD